MDQNTLTALIISGIPALGAFITAIVTAFTSAKKHTVTALQKTVDTLQEENARLVTENEKLRARIDALETAGRDSTDKLITLERDNRDLRNEVERLTIDNNRLEKENINLRTRIEQLEKQIPS